MYIHIFEIIIIKKILVPLIIGFFFFFSAVRVKMSWVTGLLFFSFLFAYILNTRYLAENLIR